MFKNLYQHDEMHKFLNETPLTEQVTGSQVIW